MSRLLARLLATATDATLADSTLGDLEEERRRRQQSSRIGADLWYWQGVGRILARGATVVAYERISTWIRRGFALGNLPGDLRVAARTLRRTPWYSLTMSAVVALSVVLGVTVFAIVDGVLFRPLPFPHADELYAISGQRTGDTREPGRAVRAISPRELRAWLAAAPGLALTGTGPTSLVLPDGSIGSALFVDSRFEDVVGVRYAIGGLRPSDFQFSAMESGGESNTPRPLVISDRLWRTQFASDPHVLGRVLMPHNVRLSRYQIVGVLSRDSLVPWPSGGGFADALLPRTFDEGNERFVHAFIRLPATEAAAGIATLLHAVQSSRDVVPSPNPALPATTRRALQAFDSVDLVPLNEYLTSGERPLFALMFGLVGCLLVLAFANMAGLAGARAMHRLRELRLRRALGASRWTLLRQVLTEHVLIALAGAAVGTAASAPLITITLGLLPATLNLLSIPTVDWRAVSFALLLASTSAFCAAVATVARASGTSRVAAWNQPHGTTPPARRTARVVVAVQTGLAFVLVLAGVLLATSVVHAWSNDPGFRVDRAATLYVQYRDIMGRQLTVDVAATLRTVPGVSSAGAFISPWLQGVPGESQFRLPDGSRPGVSPQDVNLGSGTFLASGLRLQRGRFPTDTELDTGAPVVAVSESIARAFWPDQEAIGQRLRQIRTDHEVVGVVADARFESLDLPPTPAVYAPLRSQTFAMKFFLAFDEQSPSPGSIAAVLAERHPEVRVLSMTPVADSLADSIRIRRLMAWSATAFSVAAGVLVTVGILGLVAMSAAMRTREISVRMALGATAPGVVGMVIAEQTVAVTAGLVGGGLAAVGSVGLIRTHLYGVGTDDFSMWLATAAIVMVIATVGAWIPARAASRVDPVKALRAE